MAGMEVTVVCRLLNDVGLKLAPLLVKEYSSVVGVKKDLNELQHLVNDINTWLEVSGFAIKRNDPSFNWLKRLEGVASAVNVVVDQFHLRAEKYDSCGDGGIGIVSKYMCTKTKSFIFRYKAASKIKKIKERFVAIVRERTDFNAIANSLPTQHTSNTTMEMPSWSTVDEASILGRDDEKNHLISKLLEVDDQQSVEIVSVTGLGGSGKTALAKLITNDGSIIKKHFEVRLWVHVSREFNVQKLIEKLFDAFADSKSERHPLQYIIDKISKMLTKKRFLLVLDDVWTEDKILWEEFMVHLKSGTPGSRILLTTRNRDVAEAVNSTYIFNIPCLSTDDSWQVFEQSYGTAAKGLGSDFLEVGKEIAKNCGGLPLAIKVLAGFLRDKKRLEEWQAVRDSNFLHVGDKEHRVFECLKFSYFYLPSHLKECFTICSVFPKGYRIDKDQLIDLWIAHDMIAPVDGFDYLEYSGNQCFISLVSMSFLQDLDEKDDGSVECGMHDLVHDFAQVILGATDSTETCRYSSLIEESRNIAPKNLFDKKRAIYVANGDDFIFDESLKNAKHLRSITVSYVDTDLLPTPILKVKNLRYLSISGLRFETLPESISHIQSLQALHVNSPCLRELPKSIGKLKKLRTLNLSGCVEFRIVPDSIGDCHMISSLNLYYCEKLTELPNSISELKNLRVLRLGFTKIERLPPGITALENLECLDLWLCHRLQELPEDIKNLKKLEVLNLDGCNDLRRMPAGIGQLSRLQKLGLFIAGWSENSSDISELGNIDRIGGELTIRDMKLGMCYDNAYKACLKKNTNLQLLTLSWVSASWSNVNIENEVAVFDALEPPSGIKSLHIRYYVGVECAQWMRRKVGGGVQRLHRFPCLTVLKLWYFPNLKRLEDLMELPCLVEFEISQLVSLESISGGPFPSLEKLVLDDLPRLQELWMETEMNLCYGMQIGTRLSSLHIKRCGKLVVKPCFPSSLKHLRLHTSNGQLLLSPGHCMRELRSLHKLEISGMRHLTCLPESIKDLTALQELEIRGCQALRTRCERETGEDWHLISHIPHLVVGPMLDW